jgi:hypothetical protein
MTSPRSISRRRSTPLRTTAAVVLAAGFALGVSACDDGDGDDGEPDISVVDDAGVPFDPDVPDGVGTETDEGDNQGFDPDAPGPVGNQTNPND